MSDSMTEKRANRPACLKRGPGWLMFAICLIGTFSASYAHGALNVLLPGIAAELSIQTSLIVIINISVSLVSAVLTLPFGRLGDRIGYQYLFVWGQVVLIGSTLLSGLLSLNFVMLLAFRCLIAVGAAMVQSVVQAMLTQAYPGKRGRMMGLYSMSISYSGACSPLISAAISDGSSWRMSILFGVIFSVIALILGILFLGKFECKPNKADHKGTILLVITLSSLLMALNARTITMPIYVIIGLVVVFIIAFILFVKNENKVDAPLLDLKLLKDRQFTLGFVGCLLAYMISTGTNTALPFFIQNIKGETATVSSLCTIWFTVVMGTFGPFTGGWCDKKGPFRFMLPASIIQCAVIAVYSFLNESTPLWLVVACVVCFGIGGGLFYAPITSMVMGSVPPSSGGVASGMLSTSRNLGAAFGATIFSICTGLFNNRTDLTPNQQYLSGQRIDMIIMVCIALVNVCIMAYLFIKNRNKNVVNQ